MSRKTQYLGCFGYNDSPNELGSPAGFWRYPNSDAMWGAFNRAQMLDNIFDEMGEPTYSAVLLAADADGYVLFHLFVISVQPIYPRERVLLEAAQGWITAQLQKSFSSL